LEEDSTSLVITEHPGAGVDDSSTKSDSPSARIGTDDWKSEATERTGGKADVRGLGGIVGA